MAKLTFQRYISYLLIFLLFLVIVTLKIFLSYQNPRYTSENQLCYFQSEAALQYQFSRQIAEGNSIPNNLQRLQAPEGVRVGEDLTVFQEYVCGWSYRFLIHPITGIDFFTFALFFIAVISTLPIFVIYFFGAEILSSKSSGYIGALLYAFHPLNYTRSVGSFGRENFSLFFVFLALFSLIYIWKHTGIQQYKGKIILFLSIAVLAQATAFASWHLSRFIFTLEMGIITILCLTRVIKPRQQLLTGIWVLVLIPFMFLIPSLRCRLFFISPGVILGVFLLFDYWMNLHQRIKWPGRLAAGITTIFLLGISPSASDSHVSTVIIDKIRFLLIKPQDPSMLSSESRMMWIEAFLSPPIDRVLYYFLPLLPLIILSAIGLRIHWNKRHSWRLPMAILGANTLAFTGFYILFERLHVLLTFFLFSLIVLGITQFSRGSVGRKRWSLMITGLTALMFLAETLTIYSGNPVSQFLKAHLGRPTPVVVQNYQQNNMDLINWITEETDPDAVFLAWIGVATWTYAYGDRPVILHSKFENPLVREKALHLTQALYGSEENMTDFLRKYNGDYLIYQPDFFFDRSTESLTYIAGHVDVTPQMLAMKLQFFPYDLDDLELVYQNPGFRVYRFLKTPETPYENRPINYEPIYDKAFFGVNRDTSLSNIEQLETRIALIDSLYQGYAQSISLIQRNNTAEGAELLTSIGEKCPLFYRSWVLLGNLALKQNQTDLAESYFKRALEGAPNDKEVLDLLRQTQQKEKGE
jgi:Q-cell neuroblast polarisation